MKKIIFLSMLFLALMVFTSCLKTRSEVSEQDQEMTYGKKNAENQLESQTETASAMAVVDEKDELIRGLNGRVEVLENQLANVLAAKEAASAQEAQRMALMQEALTKMELQVNALEAERFNHKISADDSLKSSDDLEREAQKDLAEASKIEKIKTDKVGSEKIKSDKVKSNKANIDNTNTEKNADEAKTKKINQKLNSYEAAEHYLNEQDWKKAIINFQKYTEESPRGKHVADAKYKIGVCFQELGMKEEAMAFYEEVVANYGDTVAGKKSKTRLRSFKK